MNYVSKLTTLVLLLTLAIAVVAQEAPRADNDILKEAAVEALIAAPPERALPLARKVLEGNHSDSIKEKALFVLSQIDDHEAQSVLLQFATSGNGDLQQEAIRMIGIGGNKDALAQLRQVYESGDGDIREAVLEALMIADDKATVLEIALTAQGNDFENAVDMLGAMDATDELRELRNQRGPSEELIEAYAISGDFDALVELANNAEDAELKIEAIEALGIVGGDKVNSMLAEFYRQAETEDVREAALDGLLISGDDATVMKLYRATDDPEQKKDLLQYLIIMDSDEAWQAIDDALGGGA